MRHSTTQIVRSTFWYTAAVIGQKILSFAYFFLLSSQLAPDTLGIYVWVLSIVSLASVGTDIGLLQLLTREAAQREDEALSLARTIMMIKIPLLALTLGVLWISLGAFGGDPRILPMLGPASVLLAADTVSMVFYGLFRSRQMVWVESIGIILFQTFVFTVGYAVLRTNPQPFLLLSVMAAGSTINALYLIIMCRRLLGVYIRPDMDGPRAKAVLRLLPAFTATNVFQKIYNVADTVLLGRLATPFDVGIYSIPAKVTTALQTLIPGAFATAIYPSLSHYARHGRDRLAELFSISFSYVSVIVLPLSAALYILARPILLVIWPQYISAVVPFQIMVAALPMVFLTYPTGSLLNAIGRERRTSAHRGIATVLNVVANLLLIPMFGVRGAATAFFVSNSILIILDMTVIARTHPEVIRPIVVRGLRTAGAALVMGAVLWILRPIIEVRISGSVEIFTFMIIGGLTYVVAALLTRAIEIHEIQRFVDHLRTKTAPV